MPTLKLSDIWLPKISTLRDIAIVVLAAPYALGHIVWAIYALLHGLGTRRAAETQYFIAGAPALAAGIIVCVIIGFLLFVAGAIGTEIEERWGRRAVIFSLATIFALFVVTILAHWGIWAVLLAIATGFVLIGKSALSNAIAIDGVSLNDDDGTKLLVSFGRRLFTSLAAFLLVAFVIWVFIYAAFIYPRIPQEFGGGHPHCALLSTSQNLSDPTWKRLALRSYAAAAERVERLAQTPKLGAASVENLRAQSAFFRERAKDAAASTAPKETGPVLMWSEDDNFVLVSVDTNAANLDSRFILSRKDVSTIELMTEARGLVVGCPMENAAFAIFENFLP
jgi:hypothetical protein